MGNMPEESVLPEDEYRIRGWMPPGTSVQIRMAPPIETELLATAESAVTFTKAVTETMERYATDKTIDERRRVARDAVAAALVQDQCDGLEVRAEYFDNPEDDSPEAEDASPEELRVKETLSRLRASARRTAREAGDTVRRVFHNDRGPWNRRTPNNELADTEVDELAAEAKAIGIIGHCAALQVQMESLAKQQDEISEEGAGRTLALWPHYRCLQVLKPQDEPDASQRLLREAYECWQRTMAQYRDEDNMRVMEENRPVQISRRASNAVGDEALKLADQFKGADPDTDAVFDWGTGDSNTATIAYRYQGCTHVKLLTEAYEHPIDRVTALEHCEDLDTELMENCDAWDPDALDPAAITLLHQGMLNRSLVLANLHYIDIGHIDQAMDVVRAVVRERTRQEDFVNAIAADQQEIVQYLKHRYDLEYPELTEAQVTAAIRAARDAGASAVKLRDMAIRLGVPVPHLPRMGLTIPERLPAGDAKEVMSHVRDLTAQSRWNDLANVIGWDDRDPLIADPTRQADPDDED